MAVGLVLEALDNVILEIFEIYSGICSSCMNVLARVFSTADASEAAEVLQILQKGTSQNSQLKAYLRLCREMGVMNATELPVMEQVSEEDISDLERIVNEGSENEDLGVDEHGEGVGVGGGGGSGEMDLKENSGTTVTENWVVFEDDEIPRGGCGDSSRVGSCEGLSGFWQLHHHTKNLSLWQGSSFNESRMSVVC